MVHKHEILDLLDIMYVKRSINACGDDFLIYAFYSLVFSPEEEAHDPVSGSDDCTPEETEKQQQESNTEIRVTVKEEEEEIVNSKQNAAIKHCWT